MSLTGSALSDTKGRLKPTVTRVTRPDGRVRLEREGRTEETSEREAGFVIDTKPDLSLSLVSGEGLTDLLYSVQILPWLYLSSQDVAGDSVLLRSSPDFNSLSSYYYSLSAGATT